MTIEKHIENLKKLKSFHNGSYGESINVAIKAIEQQKKGHWKEDRDDSRRWDRIRFYCSECGRWQSYGMTEYCPHCGARMESEE